MIMAIVSDAHLASADSDRQRAFVRWLDALEVDRLVLLGDVFHAWWGWRSVVPSDLVPACAALLRARDRGVDLLLVPGNHDFAVGPWLRERAGVRVHREPVLEVGAARVLLAHGDAPDRARGYRVASRLLRGPGFAAFLRAIGPDRGQSLLERLAGDPARPHAPDRALVQAQEAWADRVLAIRGVHAVVQGHSHALSLRRGPHGLSVLSGAWAHLRSHVALSEGRIAVYRGGALFDEAPLPLP